MAHLEMEIGPEDAHRVVAEAKKRVNAAMFANGYNHGNKPAHIAAQAALSVLNVGSVSLDTLYNDMQCHGPGNNMWSSIVMLTAKAACTISDKDFIPMATIPVKTSWQVRRGEELLSKENKLLLAENLLVAQAMRDAALWALGNRFVGKWEISIDRIHVF